MNLGPHLLHRTEWVSLYDLGGYIYSHETRCGGRIVAVLPYADTPDGRRYLLVSEVTPCWASTPVVSAVTGGWEGGDPADDAVREMREETGFTVDRDAMLPLGVSYASKSADTVYHLYTVDLTGRAAEAATGDDAHSEWITCVWLDERQAADVADPQVAVMLLRLTAAADLDTEYPREGMTTAETPSCSPPATGSSSA